MKKSYKNYGVISNGKINGDHFIKSKYGDQYNLKSDLIVKFYNKINNLDFDGLESFKDYCEDFLKSQSKQINSESLYDIWVKFNNSKNVKFENDLHGFELRFTTFLTTIDMVG